VFSFSCSARFWFHALFLSLPESSKPPAFALGLVDWRVMIKAPLGCHERVPVTRAISRHHLDRYRARTTLVDLVTLLNIATLGDMEHAYT